MSAPDGPKKVWSTSIIVRNVTSNWAGIVVSIASAFILAPLTVRSLGNVHYGIWTLLMQFTGYLWLLDFGVRESVIKYVAQYYASDDHESMIATVRTAVSLYSAVTLAVLLAALALAGALPYVFNIPPGEVTTARVTTVLVGATVAQSFVFNVFVGVVAGLQKFYMLARLNIALNIVRSIAIYLLLIAGFGIVTLAFVQFAGTLISNLLVYRLARLELPYLSVRLVRPGRDDALKLFNYGKYVFISNIGDKLVFATDSMVIGIFLPISALTYYAIGGALIEQMRTFVISMASIMNPLMSSLEARKETRTMVAVVITGAKAAMLLGLPVCIGFLVLGDRFISLWMGPDYAKPAGDVLRILTVGHLLGLPYYTISGVLYGLGRHRVVALSRIFEGVVNLTMSVILVRQIGLNGVAIGTIVPHIIVVCGILPGALQKWIPISLRDYYVATYVRPIAAAAPFFAACVVIARVVAPSTFVIFFGSILAALPLYFAAVWFIAFSPAERAASRTYIGQRLPWRTSLSQAV